MRFLWFFDFSDFLVFQWTNGTVYKEGPKDKFHCIMLATQQEIGLFVLKSLPRL
jgi:hypothetical protein